MYAALPDTDNVNLSVSKVCVTPEAADRVYGLK